MKKMNFLKRGLIIVFAIVLAVQVYAQKTKNVIIVVIDGARYTETFGDSTHQYIPKIWNQLRPLGAIYSNYYNNGTTLTNSGHSSILTGTWQHLANDGSVRPTSPTIFEYYRKQCKATQKENYVVLGKDKLNILSYSTDAQYGSDYGASVKTSTAQYNDSVTLQNIKSVLKADKPHLLITNFAATDHSGHGGIYKEYTNSLKIADNLVLDLWNYIQSDPNYRDNTTLIITNDHGRHTKDFREHGDNCDGCRHIMLMIIGPDTPAGIVDNSFCEQIDIAPTVGLYLHFATPSSQGKVIRSAVAKFAFENRK